jgi:hypothetical protein
MRLLAAGFGSSAMSAAAAAVVGCTMTFLSQSAFALIDNEWQTLR